MKKKIGEEINRLTWISIFYDKCSAVQVTLSTQKGGERFGELTQKWYFCGQNN